MLLNVRENLCINDILGQFVIRMLNSILLYPDSSFHPDSGLSQCGTDSGLHLDSGLHPDSGV